MWLFLNDAFVSIVRDRNDAGRVCVRARNRAHLERLFPADRILETSDADYACRVFVDKEVVADIVARRVRQIDYGNFKSSVGDDALHRLYQELWCAQAQYQARLTARQKHLGWVDEDLRRI